MDNINKAVNKLLNEDEEEGSRVEFEFIKIKVASVKELAKDLESKYDMSTDLAMRTAVAIIYSMKVQGMDASATARALLELPFETAEQATEAVELYSPAEDEDETEIAPDETEEEEEAPEEVEDETEGAEDETAGQD